MLLLGKRSNDNELAQNTEDHWGKHLWESQKRGHRKFKGVGVSSMPKEQRALTSCTVSFSDQKVTRV